MLRLRCWYAIGMDDNGEKPSGPAREPAGISKLARAGIAAEATGSRYRKGGTFGAASDGRSVPAWTCTCGWAGGMKELKPLPDGLACPACGEAGGLRSTS